MQPVLHTATAVLFNTLRGNPFAPMDLHISGNCADPERKHGIGRSVSLMVYT